MNLNTSSSAYGYITSDVTVNDFNDLIVNGDVYPTNFYFSQLSVPDQAFSVGFTIVSPDGATSKLDYSGTSTEIVSYFGFMFSSDLLLPVGVLSSGSTSGTYQLALGSDDGSNLYLSQTETPGPQSSPNSTLVINNDGVHGFSYKCASSAVSLSSTTKTHLELNWFQGPPFYLGVVLYYRPSSYMGTDSSCAPGVSSDATGATPNTRLGWQIVPASWYQLPQNAPIPNCND